MFLKKKLSVVFVVIIISLLISCDDSEPIKAYSGLVPMLDFKNASSLIVLESSPDGGRLADGGRREEGTSNLYKLTTSGSLEKIEFLNNDGTPIDQNVTETSIQVEGIFDVSTSYLVLTGEFLAWDTLGNSQGYTALLVNKTNGLIYDFHDAEISENSFFEDEDGNFYYRSSSGSVLQVDVSNPNMVKKSEYLPGGQTAAKLIGVDQKGNAFYINSTSGQYRIRKSNGGLYEFNSIVELPDGNRRSMNGMWMGINGKIYVETFDSGPLGVRASFHIVEVDLQGLVSMNVVWSGPWDAEFHGGGDYFLGNNSAWMQRVDKENSILFLERGKAWEFSEETNTVTEISLPNVNWHYDLSNSQDYLYFRYGLDIYKVSLSTYVSEKISLPPGDQYEIYSMSLGDEETLQFSLLRFSDGKKIIAQIDSNGLFTVLDTALDKEAIILQRLN